MYIKKDKELGLNPANTTVRRLKFRNTLRHGRDVLRCVRIAAAHRKIARVESLGRLSGVFDWILGLSKTAENPPNKKSHFGLPKGYVTLVKGPCGGIQMNPLVAIVYL